MNSPARPDPPSAFAHRRLLTGGAAALGADLSDAQVEGLLTYVDLLRRWNETYNLTAVRDAGEMVTHHLLDCLATVPPLRRELAGATGRRLLDVGSGAGLPGLVIAIAEPGLQVVCVDSVGKKVAFIAQAASTLRLANVQAAHSRVDALSLPAFDVITSRAFASLPTFVAATEAHLRQGGFWMAMKGKTPDAEIAALPGGIDCRTEQVRVPHLASERCLLWLRKTH